MKRELDSDITQKHMHKGSKHNFTSKIQSEFASGSSQKKGKTYRKQRIHWQKLISFLSYTSSRTEASHEATFSNSSQPVITVIFSTVQSRQSSFRLFMHGLLINTRHEPQQHNSSISVPQNQLWRSSAGVIIQYLAKSTV